MTKLYDKDAWYSKKNYRVEVNVVHWKDAEDTIELILNGKPITRVDDVYDLIHTLTEAAYVMGKWQRQQVEVDLTPTYMYAWAQVENAVRDAEKEFVSAFTALVGLFSKSKTPTPEELLDELFIVSDAQKDYNDLMDYQL